MFHQEIFQEGPKTEPRSTYMSFLYRTLHSRKWPPDFEKSVQINFLFGPYAAPGCHLKSRGLIPGPFAWNVILRILWIWPKMPLKLSCWKISKDKTGSSGLFLMATLSQHTAKEFPGKFSTGNFSVRPEIGAPVRASALYHSSIGCVKCKNVGNSYHFDAFLVLHILLNPKW